MRISEKSIQSMRDAVREADGSFRKIPVFISLVLLYSDELQAEDGPKGKQELEIFLDEIGVPTSYLYQMKSLIKVKSELRNLGFELRRIDDGRHNTERQQ